LRPYRPTRHVGIPSRRPPRAGHLVPERSADLPEVRSGEGCPPGPRGNLPAAPCLKIVNNSFLRRSSPFTRRIVQCRGRTLRWHFVSKLPNSRRPRNRLLRVWHVHNVMSILGRCAMSHRGYMHREDRANPILSLLAEALEHLGPLTLPGVPGVALAAPRTRS